MKTIFLFTDGSVNAQTKVGYGAYLSIAESDLNLSPPPPQVKRFINTSSTRLELQTLLWAMDEIGQANLKVVIYTDSQNIISLQERRVKLLDSGFKSKSGRLLNNHQLYRQFYKTVDQYECELRQVPGHSKRDTQSTWQQLFALVDKASRHALRRE